MLKKILFSTAVLCLLLTPVFTYASIDNNLYYGLQKNSDVKQLQEFLIDKGLLTGSATGNFFSLTLKAVKAYQSSAGINSTGYVGTLTRAAINNELAANLSASNQESTTETGATPPTPMPPATTNDVVAQLQAQIALLQKQLDALNSQQTTLSQIQQNTQQIAQNTTYTPPTPTCTPNWQCTAWSTCTNSQQTRTCTDSNSCNNNNGEPSLTEYCSPAPVCTPDWKYSGFSVCKNDIQTKIFTDSNNCNTTAGEPFAMQHCGLVVAENPNFVDQTFNPNSTEEIGSFMMQNLTSGSVNVSSLTVSFSFGSGTSLANFSNLRIFDSYSTGIQPQNSNVFNINKTLAQGQGLQINFYIDSGSDVGPSATIHTALAIASDALNTTVDGQTITFNNGVITPPTPTPTTTPTITNIVPGTGPVAGGTNITITGTGFTKNSTVLVGGNPATNVAVVNGNEITATTPTGSVGPQNVVVFYPWALVYISGNSYGGFIYQ